MMIELNNITLSRDKKFILKDFNLHIEPQERLVIVGKSGSGKTTILRLIAGLEAPDKGEIIISNKLATKDSHILTPPFKRETNMLFQDLALWPHLNVEKNIEFGLKIQKVPQKQRQEKIKEILDLIDLNHYEKRSIDTLSGGEQQRVAIARALVLSPKILLMDEPLSSLDQTNNKILRKEIIKLQEKFKFTLVYISHNLEEAEEIATKLLELKK